MGGWQLEVGKMALYMSFPVGMFYYFNQPQYFEKWVIETKRAIYPPQDLKQEDDLRQCISDHRKNYEIEMMKKLEQAEKKRAAM